ncbi:unnamed protein product [Urochloa humidicola]
MLQAAASSVLKSVINAEAILMFASMTRTVCECVYNGLRFEGVCWSSSCLACSFISEVPVNAFCPRLS